MNITEGLRCSLSGLKAILSEVGVTNPERLKDNVKSAGYEKNSWFIRIFGLWNIWFNGIFDLFQSIVNYYYYPLIHYPYDHFGGNINQSGLLLTLQRHNHLHMQLSPPARFQGARTSR